MVGVYAPAREPGLEDARLEELSLKLDGGALFRAVRTVERPSVPWKMGICCTRARKVCSGVCARAAEFWKDNGGFALV